ncbi:hypothetical protein LOZ36_003276 [Ophidiomyces ophidiicola]|nr:hypothetical protein LOZ36_003276 [Ophidiomyces ophidiicola]
MELLTYLFAIAAASMAVVAVPTPQDGAAAPIEKREPEPAPVDKRWCSRVGQPC